MDVENVLGNLHVILVRVDIFHYKNAVKPRQDSSLKIHLLAYLHHLIIPPKHRVCRCQHRSPGIQSGSDTSLGNTDSLLLHGLVDGHSVGCFHLVELVDADYAAICQYQCASFYLELARGWVFVDTGCQTGGGGPFATGVHCDGGCLLHEL